MTGRTCALALAVALLAAAVLPLPGPAAEPVKLSLNFIPYGLHAGFYVAREKGFYREAGLEVEILKGDGSADALRRLGTGAVEFAFADMSAQIIGRARGLKVRAVGVVLDRDPSVFLSLKSTGIRTPKDLAGKSVGALTASALRDTWPAVAAANGVDPGAVTWVDMPGSAYVASLLSKKVHAIGTYLTTLPSYEIQAKRLGEEMAVLAFADWGMDNYGAGLVTGDQTIKDKPDLVRRFVLASMRGYAAAFEAPAEAVQLFAKAHPEANPERVRAEIKIAADLMLTPVAAREGIGHYDRAKVGLTREHALRPKGFDPAAVPLDEIYTNEFLPRLFPKRNL
jgi:NitT/TauT family transport system substrate-binding protein